MQRAHLLELHDLHAGLTQAYDPAVWVTFLNKRTVQRLPGVLMLSAGIEAAHACCALARMHSWHQPVLPPPCHLWMSCMPSPCVPLVRHPAAEVGRLAKYSLHDVATFGRWHFEEHGSECVGCMHNFAGMSCEREGPAGWPCFAVYCKRWLRLCGRVCRALHSGHSTAGIPQRTFHVHASASSACQQLRCLCMPHIACKCVLAVGPKPLP